MQKRRSLFAISILSILISNVNADFKDSPPPACKDLPMGYEYFKSASGLKIPQKTQYMDFKPSNKKANFTFFDGVKNVSVKDGKLSFKMSSGKAVLGWGNYMGRQPLKEIKSLFLCQNTIIMKIRQKGCEKSRWTMKEWYDGKEQDAMKSVTKTLKGNEWQEFSISCPPVAQSIPSIISDGLSFEIKAQPGTEFEIESFKVENKKFEGYVRKEFTLPAGKIWKAMANVGGTVQYRLLHTDLYVNGKKIERDNCNLYGTVPVDLKPYLKAGAKNCIGFYGTRITHPPFIYLQAKVIMEDGRIFEINTNKDWTYSPKVSKGWSKAGYNASSWKKCLQLFRHEITNHYQMCYPWLGLLKLRNPHKKDLFFSASHDLEMIVLIPEGLKTKNPVIDYIISKSDSQGLCTEIKKGTIKNFSADKNSLKFQLNAGKIDDGVYTVALSLKDSKGNVLEKRYPEPFVILKKIAQKKITPKNYKEGMDLELEDEIDFTNPDDPHEWVETLFSVKHPAKGIKKPLIVERNGLKYREVTGNERGDRFSYRIDFKHPGDWYLFELYYPDDRNRCVEVSVTSCRADFPRSQGGAGAETGGKFFISGKMKKLFWVQIADHGSHALDIMNVYPGWKSAVQKIKIYHIKGKLPEVSTGVSRWYGIHTERCFDLSGMASIFGLDLPRSRTFLKGTMKLPLVQNILVKLYSQKMACDNFAQYLRFSGQNLHIMGCLQYTTLNTPYTPAFMNDVPCAYPCIRRMLSNVLNENGIDFLAGIEFSQDFNMNTHSNNAQVLNGADTVWMIDRDGRQFYGAGKIRNMCKIPNWLHPAYQKSYFDFIKGLNRTFGEMKHYRGVSNLNGLAQRSNYYAPAFGYAKDYDDPLRFSYDDLTFKLFEKDSGINLGISRNDPTRFSKRANLIKNSKALQKKFLEWRCTQFRDFLAKSVKVLNSKRSNLKFVDFIPTEDPEFFKFLHESGRSVDDFLKDFAIDLGKLSTIPNLIPIRCTFSWRAGFGLEHQNPYTWIAKEDRDFIKAFNKSPERGVMCRSSWDENHKVAEGCKFSYRKKPKRLKGSDWQLTHCKTRAHPQPSDCNAREALIQGIITSDPTVALSGFCDASLNIGHEQTLREVMCLFTKIPHRDFTVVLNTGLTTNLAIRKLNGAKDSWFYVANPGYWDIKGKIDIDAGGSVFDIASGKKVAGQGKSKLPVDLEPFGLKVFRVESPDLSIKSYSTSGIGKSELANMRRIIKRVRELVSHKNIKLVLPLEKRKFMLDTAAEAEKELNKGNYARAWSILKTVDFWYLWQFYLEDAAKKMAFLPGEIDLPEKKDIKSLPTIEAVKIKGPFDIRASILNDDNWKRAPWGTAFYTIKDGNTALNPTAVKVLYDDKNLYFGFILADKAPGKIKATADDEREVFRDDSVGILIKPDNEDSVYYQMAFNPKGVKFDQRANTNGLRDYKFSPEWSVYCDKNKNGKYWSAVAVFPYKAFGLGNHGKNQWRINIFRVMRNRDLPISVWSLPKAEEKGGKLHNTKRFGYLNFRS